MKHYGRLTVIPLAVSVLSSITVNGQTLKPSYLSEMPAPARIISEIKGKDAEDTIERQMGAFQALIKMIDDMAYGLEKRYLPNRATPDEAKMRLAYGQAYADLWHKATKKEDHLYDHDPQLLGELLARLFSPGFRDLYSKSDANAAEHLKAFQAKMYGPSPTSEPTPNPGSKPLTTAANSAAVTPGSTTEMRRCLESGRSQRICFSETMTNGMDQLTGISTKVPTTAGLRMTGAYSGPRGLRLIFQPDKAVLTCSEVSSPLPYGVEVTNTQALIKIQNGATTVVFALQPDGKLAGSGTTTINGITAAGTRTEQTMGTTTRTTTRQRELTPLEARNYPDAQTNGQIKTIKEESTETSFGPTGTTRKINYENKKAQCSLGLMTPTGPTPLPPDIENPMGLLTTILSGTSVLMKGGSTKDAVADMFNLDKAPPPGLRMGGKYVGANGFSITFHPESASVACGNAERALAYSVQRTANQVLLKIQDKTDPITLQLKPDGSLFGTGTVQVNGRTIVGTTDDPDNPYTFAPKVARCTLGSLVAN
ncbi:MAG: hypothetical protein ABJB49_10490 [Nitrospirota bacterium]